MMNKETAIEDAVSDLLSKRRLSKIRRDLAADGFQPEDIGEILREAMERAKVVRKEERRILRRHNLLFGVPIIAFAVGYSIYAWQQKGMLLIPLVLIAYGVFECLGGRNFLKLLFGMSIEPTKPSGRRRGRRG